MKKMEILAPAGSPDSLIAGVNSGADAVYFGYGSFNARRNAKNFDENSLRQMSQYCKARGVKMYMTLNTLVYDRELKDVEESVRAACENGIDAILVQDFGVMELLRRIAPDIPLHASTQMAIHNVSGARQLYEMGFSRVVLAREMSAEEIRAVVEQVPVETEIFVHGALCMCLSGQCYMSSLIGERSGNRGLCAQPCRLPFSTGRGDNGYALSLKDLTLVDRMRQLEALGVDSLKIEGRMKRPEYVSAAVTGFRQAMDGQKPDLRQLEAAFSRSGFTRGYFDGKIGLDMFGTRQHEDVLAGQKVLKELSGQLGKQYARVPLDFSFVMLKDQPMMLTVTDDAGHAATVEGPEPQTAMNRPTTEALVQRSMEKLGDTFYYLSSLYCSMDDGLMCPASQLNHLRREALDELTRQRSAFTPWNFIENAPEAEACPPCPRHHQPAIRTQVRTVSQITPLMMEVCQLVAVPLHQLKAHIQELPAEYLPKLSVTLPRLTFGDDAAVLREDLLALKKAGITHLSTGNIGGVHLGRELGFTLHGEFSLNITNSPALHQYKEFGLADAVLSWELSMARARDIAPWLPKGLMAYGHLPLMVTRNCPVRLSGCRDCKQHGTLKDRRGEIFDVRCTQRQYSEVFNGKPLYLADKMSDLSRFDFLLLYFTGENARQCDEILRSYTETFAKKENITRGLYYRNVK